MVKIQKQFKERNHKYSLASLLMEGIIAPSYKAILSEFLRVVTDNLGLETKVISPKILEASTIAIQATQHFDYVEVVCKEILSLGHEYTLAPEFQIFINSNHAGNFYSCLSFKLKYENGYFIQVSRYTSKKGASYETKVKAGSSYELIKSETLSGIFEQLMLLNDQKVPDKCDQNPLNQHLQHAEELDQEATILVST